MWFPLALVYALITSIHIPIIKKVASSINALPFIFTANLFIIPLMIFGTLLLQGLPSITPSFFVFIIISSILDTIAFVLSVWAFANSSISLVVPLAAFNPVFTTIIALFFLHEMPTAQKFTGIITIVIGAYLLNVTDVRESILSPFRKLYKVKGVKYFLVANLLWSITPIFQKKAILESSPASPTFVSTIGTILMSLYILPIILKRKEKILKFSFNYKWWLLLGAILVTFQQFSLTAAYVLTNVGYVSAVGKLSSIFIIIWGALFFKEERIRERLLGASVMVAGTILLVI